MTPKKKPVAGRWRRPDGERLRVRVEPVLEQSIIGMEPEAVLRRARAHFRWAKQLYVLACVMEQDGVPRVPAPAPLPPPAPHPERN